MTTTVYVVLEWEGDHTSAIVGVFGVEATAEGVAAQGEHRTVEAYEIDQVEDWARR